MKHELSKERLTTLQQHPELITRDEVVALLSAHEQEPVAVPNHLTYLKAPTISNILANDDESPMANAARILAIEVNFWRSVPLYTHPAPSMPADLHPDTQQLVADFSTALAEKLYKAQLKYGYSDHWKRDGWAEVCLQQFQQHIGKGDPRDVAAYCAFMWFHNWHTELPAPSIPAAADDYLLAALENHETFWAMREMELGSLSPEATMVRDVGLRAIAKAKAATSIPAAVPGERDAFEVWALTQAYTTKEFLVANRTTSGYWDETVTGAEVNRLWRIWCSIRDAMQGNSPVITDDERRMDWLVSKTVNVREPQVYGSHDLFWSQTISDDWEDEHKTTLREQIDAAMAAAPKGV